MNPEQSLVPTPVLNHKPIPTKRVLMHWNPHLDELLPDYLMRRYGEPYFPGIKSSPILYCEGDILGNDAQYDADGDVPLGIGGGRFNEHRQSETSDRLDKETTTTLMAKWISVMHLPELKPLLLEAYLCDKTAKATPTMLASIIKAANRSKTSNGELHKFVMTVFAAIIERQKFRIAKNDAEKTLMELVQEIIATTGPLNPNPVVHNKVLRMVEESMERKDKYVTEFAHIVECLYRAGFSETTVKTQVNFVLKAWIVNQEEFRLVLSEIKKERPIYFRALIGQEMRRMRLRVVRSTSALAANAGRFLGADIVLVVNPETGNCLIATDHKSGLNILDLKRMVLWMESDDKTLTWHELGSPGKHPKVDNWYYFPQAQLLANGTETHKARRTRISAQSIIDSMLFAFTPGGVEEWCRRSQITMPPRSDIVQEKPVLQIADAAAIAA